MGSQTLSTLTASAISNQAIQALQPFLGLTGNAAVSMVGLRGDPIISSADAQQLFTYTYNNIASSLLEAWITNQRSPY